MRWTAIFCHSFAPGLCRNTVGGDLDQSPFISWPPWPPPAASWGRHDVDFQCPLRTSASESSPNVVPDTVVRGSGHRHMGGNRVGGQLLGFFRQRVLDGELMRNGDARSLDTSAPARVWLHVFRTPLSAAPGVPSPHSVCQAPKFRWHLCFTVYFLFSLFGMVFRI